MTTDSGNWRQNPSPPSPPSPPSTTTLSVTQAIIDAVQNYHDGAIDAEQLAKVLYLELKSQGDPNAVDKVIMEIMEICEHLSIAVEGNILNEGLW